MLIITKKRNNRYLSQGWAAAAALANDESHPPFFLSCFKTYNDVKVRATTTKKKRGSVVSCLTQI
jgi:hypothetical protein